MYRYHMLEYHTGLINFINKDNSYTLMHSYSTPYAYHTCMQCFTVSWTFVMHCIICPFSFIGESGKFELHKERVVMDMARFAWGIK